MKKSEKDIKYALSELLRAHDEVSHADMIHLLTAGECTVLYADNERGVAVEHPCGTVYAAPFTDDIMPMIEAIGPDRALMNSQDRALADWYRRELGWSFLEECWTYRYDPAKGFLDEGPYSYRVMTEDDYDILRGNYGFGDDEAIHGHIERGDVFAMEDGSGRMLGFAGFHPEGSVGLLEIFPENRGRGLGTFMESHVINEAMRRGRVPFCNVYCSNEASASIQERLGLEKGAILSWWVWPERVDSENRELLSQP